MAASPDAPEPRRRGASDRKAGRGAWIGGGIVIVALAIFIWRMRSPDAEWVTPKELDERMPATDVNAPVTAPNLAPGSPAPGPAPPGKVWSPEHGHWHDIPPEGSQPVAPPPGADGSMSLTPMQPMPAATPLTPGPQPEGPVPPGKVWSPEHGHWHDAAPDGSAQPMQVTPIPAPDGTATPGTLTPQPEGPAPPGKVWSAEHGHWHDAAPPG
jgi:hypothetical protein